MSVLIIGHGQALAKWAARRIPHVGDAGFGPCDAVGIATGFSRDDKLLAVVVYHDLVYDTCQLSCAAASPRWASPSTIRALLSVPFEQWGCRKVWTATPSSNVRALRFNEGIGFRREAVLRHHFAQKQHAVICSMMRSEYERRWASRMQVAA
jgi:RimJ/RimL family protein N-acetyltransferase